MEKQIKPKRLAPGARIGIVNPAYWLEEERLQRASRVFEEFGYRLVPGDSTRRRKNRYAGSAKSRAADIMAMFCDGSIDAILCARGGYGGNRVLPRLDYDLIRANPKIFVGYSDVTGINLSMAQRSGLVTFHGPMLTSFGEQTVPYNLDTLFDVLSGREMLRIESVAGCRAQILKPGSGRGPAWGGNVSLLVERLGTKDQVNTRGCILFLEEIGESLHVFDRMLLHLRHSGSLEHINGLVIGELTEMEDGEVPFGKDTDEIVLDVCADLDIPIISNFPCGHGKYQATLPIGHEIELDALGEKPFILIPEAPVA